MTEDRGIAFMTSGSMRRMLLSRRNHSPDHSQCKRIPLRPSPRSMSCPIPSHLSPSNNRWWPFQLDDITFWVRDVDGWTLPFGAVARFHWSCDYSMRFKHATNTGFVERLYPKAKVIKIAAFNAWRRATSSPQLAPDRHKIN